MQAAAQPEQAPQAAQLQEAPAPIVAALAQAAARPLQSPAEPLTALHSSIRQPPPHAEQSPPPQQQKPASPPARCPSPQRDLPAPPRPDPQVAIVPAATRGMATRAAGMRRGFLDPHARDHERRATRCSWRATRAPASFSSPARRLPSAPPSPGRSKARLANTSDSQYRFFALAPHPPLEGRRRAAGVV